MELTDIFINTVTSMRQSGTNDFVSGVATVSNTFQEDNWVNIDGEEFQIITADSTSFTVSGLGDGNFAWFALAPYDYIGTKKEIQARLDDKTNGTTLGSQKYPMIALQVPFQINGYDNGGGELSDPEVDGIGQSTGVSVLFIQDTDRDNTLPYQERIDTIIKPILKPLAKQFKEKLSFNPDVSFAETQSVDTIPNFGETSSQGKEKQVTPDPWEVVEGIYDITLMECK